MEFLLSIFGVVIIVVPVASFSATLSHDITLKSATTRLFSVIQDKSTNNEGELGASQLSSFLRNRRHIQIGASAVEVQEFHVRSELYSRFAKVTITSEMMNMAEESKETEFKVQIPETAFMSFFSMMIDGQVHVAEVLEKKAAEEKFRAAKMRNETAGLVKQEPVKPQRGMEHFTVSVNLASLSIATFTLIYNELLERRGGIYTQRLMIQPGSIVGNMSVRTSFTENQGFTYFAYSLPGSDKKITSSSEADKTMMMAMPNSRELVFQPTVEMQKNFDSKSGIQGEFVIFYSVSSEPEGGSIIVQKNHFAHFFAPPDLDPLPKNILFIIDISGSMSGEKIQQARIAMIKILEDLAGEEADSFNILLFDDAVEVWRPYPTNCSYGQIAKAKSFVQEKLVSRGGTNIHSALLQGLDLLLTSRSKKSCEIADIIIFLTDGDPTTGVVNIDKIISDVTVRNKDRASIFSLGFGFSMNFDFLSRLAHSNRGFARRIYEDSDAKDQLKNFYDEISTPVLCDVVVSYSSDVVDSDTLTSVTFPLFFQGREIIVAGKTKLPLEDQEPPILEGELQGTGGEGVMDFVVPVDKIRILSVQDVEVEDDLTEKLWAYLKIKSLLKDLENTESEAEQNRIRAQAVNMSLNYGFVTPLTSFVIAVENSRSERKVGLAQSFWSATQRKIGLPQSFDAAYHHPGVLIKQSHNDQNSISQASWKIIYLFLLFLLILL